MLEIGTLSLTLPAGYAPRAARIGRLVGEHLSAVAPGVQAAHIETLALPPVRIGPGWSDRRIAAHVASLLARHIAGGAPC